MIGPSDGNLVGIIGAGRLGQAMARTALRAGRSVVIANSRGPESLTSVVSSLGAGVSAGTVGEAASAGIVVVAVPWDRLPEAVQGLDWNVALFQDGGFAAIDLGDLATGGLMQQIHRPLAGLNLIRL